jgi:hypothetical protein
LADELAVLRAGRRVVPMAVARAALWALSTADQKVASMAVTLADLMASP